MPIGLNETLLQASQPVEDNMMSPLKESVSEMEKLVRAGECGVCVVLKCVEMRGSCKIFRIYLLLRFSVK